MSENAKKLYRSTSDRMIAGICGGLGDYFGIDPTLVRLIFVFGAIFTGSALFWAYIIMLIVVPEQPSSTPTVIEPPATDEQASDELSETQKSE